MYGNNGRDIHGSHVYHIVIAICTTNSAPMGYRDVSLLCPIFTTFVKLTVAPSNSFWGCRIVY